MMKFKSCFLLVLLLCCTFALAEEPIETQTDSTGVYEYTLLENGSAEIIRYRGKDQILEIPAELDGHPLTSIGEKAFFFCDSLTDISIPDSVSSIGEGAFASCDALQSIHLSPDHPVFAVIDNVLFDKTSKTLILYPGGLTASEYSIPDGILAIGDYTFDDCTSLTTISIPDSVSSIGEYAFYSCDSLTTISIPDSVTSIGDNAFAYCRSLTAISIPDSVSSIGEGTFAYCDSLSTISIPDSVTSIGKDAFANCENLTLIVGRNSYAHTYAQENGLNFTYPDANDWLNS